MVLKDVIKIDERFQTSVNIRFDIDKTNKIDEFIPAKSTLDVLETYLENIFEKGNNKATLLVGPYGKGKSHLLLVLLALLRNRDDKKWHKSIVNFYNKIKNKNKKLEEEIEKNILCEESRKKKYLPIIISFGRSGLETSYRLALFQALQREKLSEIQEFDYKSATSIALVMLVASFLILFLMKLQQKWIFGRENIRIHIKNLFMN